MKHKKKMKKEEYNENIFLYKKYVLFMFAIFLLSAAGVFMEKKRHEDYLENSAIKRKFEVYYVLFNFVILSGTLDESLE